MNDALESELQELHEQHSREYTASDSAYWTIRDSIRLGLIQPGQNLMEVSLAKTLGISRTPVRDALRRLENERLIESMPRKGYVIPKPTYDDLFETFELSECLESFAASRAAVRMSRAEVDTLEACVVLSEQGLEEQDMNKIREGGERLHRLIRYGSKVKRLPEILSVLRDSNRALELVEYSSERVRLAVAEHREIYEAIAAGDADLAEQRMQEHARNAFRAQVQALGLL